MQQTTEGLADMCSHNQQNAIYRSEAFPFSLKVQPVKIVSSTNKYIKNILKTFKYFIIQWYLKALQNTRISKWETFTSAQAVTTCGELESGLQGN